MARASLLHYHQSFADPKFYDHSPQLLQPAAAIRQDTSTRSQLTGNYQTQAMTQPYTQQYKTEGGLDHQQWQQSDVYMQAGGTQAGHSSMAAAFPRDQLWVEGAALDHGFANGRPYMPHNLPQSDGSSYGNGALAYPESASSAFGNSGGGCAVPWPTPESFGLPDSVRNDAFDRGTSNSHSPTSYNSETQASEAQPFTPKSIPSTASAMGDWSCGSAQPYTAIKASSPNVPAWGIEHRGTAATHFSGLPQHGLGMAAPMASSIGSSPGFNGLPAIYSDTSQHGSDYSYSQQSSPGLSPGFQGGPSLLSYQSTNLLARSAPVYGLPIREHARASNGTSGVPTLRDEPSRSVPKRESDQAHSNPESASDFHALRRADDAILLEGKRNGLTYKDIRKRMHKKCAESTLRGRYRSLTKARQDRVRKPVWREKDIELLTEFVTRDLNRIDASFHNSLSIDQRLVKVQWKKVADAIHSHGGSYHFGNSTCKRKWVELNPEP